MKVGNLQTTGDMAAAHGLHRIKQRNSLGPPARDGQNYAVVHCTGYIKNWPPTGEFGTMSERTAHKILQCATVTGLSVSLPLGCDIQRISAFYFKAVETSRPRGIRTNRSWNVYATCVL